MYRTIDTRFWTDPKVRKLSSQDKLLFLYLISNQHTHVSGIYYLPIPLIVHETGLSPSEVRRGIDTLSMGYLCLYDATTEVVWVVNMLKYQSFPNIKILVGVANQLKTLHPSDIIKKFLQHYDTLSIPYRYPIDDQEQEQEQEQEQNTTTPLSPLLQGGNGKGEGKDSCESKKESSHSIFDIWNQTVTKLPKALTLNEPRRQRCKLAEREHPLEWWRHVFEKLETLPFYCGQNESGWKADFDWIIGLVKTQKCDQKGTSDINAVKILEREPTPQEEQRAMHEQAEKKLEEERKIIRESLKANRSRTYAEQ